MYTHRKKPAKLSQKIKLSACSQNFMNQKLHFEMIIKIILETLFLTLKLLFVCFFTRENLETSFSDQ